MSISLALQLLAASTDAPRSIPIPNEDIVKSAQPSGCSGNIIIDGVCFDECTYPAEIRDLSCQKTTSFDEFACSYNIRFDQSPAVLGSYWEQRMDIIIQNQEGEWVRDRALTPAKTYINGKLQP
jgi:hypothetical protein